MVKQQGLKYLWAAGIVDLELGLIGNGTIGALIDEDGRIVWGCMPRFDGDPAFCALVDRAQSESGEGSYAIELVDQVGAEQRYLPNTAILETRLHDSHGGSIRIVDFCPRFKNFGRTFRPNMIVRQVEPTGGSPRVCIRLRPTFDYGAHRAARTHGSNHIRYVCAESVIRLTTDLSITSILDEVPFVLDRPATLLLGPDETVADAAAVVGRRFFEQTQDYWQEWVRYLGIPFEWQDEVIRAAITLKLNAYEDTGAIIAAMTTSIPEAPGSGRNWDYRYCWLRDAYFVVAALNRLSATKTMEQYLHYIINVVAGDINGGLRPVYRINGRCDLEESVVPALAGYRDHGPVRVGNQAYLQQQNDVYGSAILAATHIFFDRRIAQPGDESLFRRLERLGELAVDSYATPDAGLWELRNSARVHTFSAVMCWAACDRLAKVAARLGLADREGHWRERADAMHGTICERAWNTERKAFVDSFDGEEMDASLLLLHEFGFLAADDPRFVATVAAVEKDLKHGDFIYRYAREDDFGHPETAFVICTFWYIDALAALGRVDEARALFEKMLTHRNRHGLLSEDLDVVSGELWGNFPQTYSMVGLINAAMRLSIPWEEGF